MLESHLPPRDLLEATHEFPCHYTFKVIGECNERFVDDVVAAVRNGMDLEFDPPYGSRESSGGRHVALTFEPLTESPEQVLAVYAAIQQTEGVILLL
ncbi:YbeD family protein [Rubinisphaera margarita]|uniref:YbeD family protein n=1 Tax=Rubinisphaera margarita TaxID=2909586 RepID=UPI001EE9616F|nr:DUF493 domain-containing protein [Rubinisphaera margarita]MCG6156030.1 DUF493 domain-containing protein [Rubinisphaera margarita]